MLIVSLILGVILGKLLCFKQEKKDLVLNTLYGEFIITEPVLIDVINDAFMQRLKLIRQYGTRYYATKPEQYDRFEHSVGVFVLLRKYGASLPEQIAGLLHDVSHTVFSHVGDHFFKGQECYQDCIHEEFINGSSLAHVLKKHAIQVGDILHKNLHFTGLEQELPDICADRLEYNLKGGLVEGLLQEADIEIILKSLIFENNRWIFVDAQNAKKFAQIPLHLTQNVWGSSSAIVTYDWTAQALQRALDLNLITLDEIKYSTDELVWNKMAASEDAQLQLIIQKILNYNDYFMVVDNDDYDTIVKGKFRGINPWVKQGEQLVRLTELDEDFRKEFFEVKDRMQAGWRIKFTNKV